MSSNGDSAGTGCLRCAVVEAQLKDASGLLCVVRDALGIGIDDRVIEGAKRVRAELDALRVERDKLSARLEVCSAELSEARLERNSSEQRAKERAARLDSIRRITGAAVGESTEAAVKRVADLAGELQRALDAERAASAKVAEERNVLRGSQTEPALRAGDVVMYRCIEKMTGNVIDVPAIVIENLGGKRLHLAVFPASGVAVVQRKFANYGHEIDTWHHRD